MGLEIRIRYPDGNEQTLAIAKDTVSVGRSEDNDLALAFPFVSKRHCRFVQQGTKVMIEDVGSLNGVVVNEQAMDKLSTQVLRPEDVVHLGTVQITVRAQPNPTAPPPSLDDDRTSFESDAGQTTFESTANLTTLESEKPPASASEKTGLTGRTMIDPAAATPPPPRPGATAATSPLPGHEPEREFTATMWEMQTGVYQTDEVRIDDRRMGTQNAGVALPPPPGFLSGEGGARSAAPSADRRATGPHLTAGLVGMVSQLLALGTIFAVLLALALLVLS